MTTAETISDRLVDWLARRVLITTGTREELRKKVAEEFSQVVPSQQAALNFADQEALKGQSEAVLKLLKARRSQGALNWELAEIALKYTSRVSDLRKAGYRIDCRAESGRTHRYILQATDW